MKSVRNRMALALVAACGLASAAHAQVYSSNPNLAIPDNPTVVATIDVSGFTGTVTDLNVVVNITHTFDGDLDYILIPPGGTGVQFLHLSTDNGSTGDNFTYTRFDNEAAVVIPTTGAPYCGDYRPEGGSMATGWAAVSPYSLAELGTGVADLTAFNGIDPNGTWTLVIDDDLGGDTGVLQHWALEFNGGIDPATNNPIVATANASGDANGSAAVSIVATGPCRAGGTPVDSVSVDASSIGGGVVALTGPGTGNTWTGSIPISNSTAPGTYTLTSSATLGAVTVNGVVNLTVRPAAPGCASGSATASFSNMISTVAVSAAIPPATQPGDATTNTIVQSTQTAPGTATALRVTGRYIEANAADLQTENRLRVVAPSGNAYVATPFPVGPDQNPRDLTNFLITFPSAETIAGDWYFESGQSINDTNEDGRWSTICFAWANPPVGTPTTPLSVFAGNPLPGFGSSANFEILVAGGTPPYTVSVDGNAAGIGTVNLTDGDNNGSYTASVPATNFTGPGTYTLPYLITDAANETFGGSIVVSVRSGVTDLGTVSIGNMGTLVSGATLNTGDIRWFKFTTCVDTSAPSWFDVVTSGVISGGTNPNDTEVGFYRADGTMLANDDDDGVLAGSALSFGAGSGLQQGGTGTLDTAPVLSNGRDGAATLTAGEYYMAIGHFNVTFNATNFNVTTTGLGSGTVDATFDTDQTCGPVCNDIDFNNDGSFFDPQDIDAFLSVYSEGPCIPDGQICDDIDFNNDTSIFDPCDINSFLLVYSEGPCELCPL